MHLVDKEDRALIVKRPTLLGLRHRFADVFDAGEHSVERAEMSGRRVGDHLGQGRLAGAGRAIEDQAAQPVRLNRPPQESPRPHNRFLADELVQAARTHARGQGRVGIDSLNAGGLKQIVRRFAPLCITRPRRKLPPRLQGSDGQPAIAALEPASQTKTVVFSPTLDVGKQSIHGKNGITGDKVGDNSQKGG